MKIFNSLNIPLKYCLCDEGKNIQSILIDHVMSYFDLESPTTQVKNEINQVEVKLEETDWGGAVSEYSYEDGADFDHHSEDFTLSTFTSTSEEPQKCFVCDSCTFSTPDRHVLRLHWISEHEPSNQFPCTRKYCRNRFKSQNELDVHASTHKRSTAQTTNLLCHICSKSLLTAGQLQSHLKTHQEKSFCCDLCGSKFKTRQEIKVHVLRHKGLWQYSTVQRLYPMKTRVKKERVIKIPDELKPYRCEYEGCQRRFKVHSQLIDHVNVHLGIKPFKCDYCSETFRAKNALTTHQKIHTDPYKHWCHVCQRTFATKNALQDHNDSHHDLLPYCCSYCQQTFRFKKQLIAHIETHERITCEICSKSVLAQRFEKHKLKHQTTIAGDKPFKCDFPDCTTSFMWGNRLNKMPISWAFISSLSF